MERKGQGGRRLDWSEERGHFMSKLDLSLQSKDQEIQTCSSNQRQFKDHVNT